MGRRPNDDDLVLPLAPEVAMRTKLGAWRRKEWVHKHFAIDLAALGMRHRRGHDLRRTFISLARSDGADTAILRRATHKPTQEVIEGYTTFLWDVVCREVAKLKVERRATGKLLRLPKVG